MSNWAGGFGLFGLFFQPCTEERHRRAYLHYHILTGGTALIFGLMATITGNQSLVGRGDNVSAKDRLFKGASLLTMLLVPALGAVFSFSGGKRVQQRSML